MHGYRLGLQMTLLVVSPRDDLMTCSSFLDINPEKPGLLCASSLIDSSVNDKHRYRRLLLCVLPHGHAGARVVP